MGTCWVVRRSWIVSARVTDVTRPRPERESIMLYTIAVVLLIAWLLGFVGIYTVGSFLHVLLVVALVLFVVGRLSGRRSLI